MSKRQKQNRAAVQSLIDALPPEERTVTTAREYLAKKPPKARTRHRARKGLRPLARLKS